VALDAQRARRQALTRAGGSRPGATAGFLRVFVDLGPQMKELLGRLAEQSLPPSPFSYPGGVPALAWEGERGHTAPSERGDRPAPSVPALLTVDPSRTSDPTLLREPLYPKETLASRHLLPDCETHSLNIYGKLGVNTRWDAVNRAVELGSCLRVSPLHLPAGPDVPLTSQ